MKYLKNNNYSNNKKKIKKEVKIMNKKVTIIAIIFMFFLSTCGAFAQSIPVKVGTPKEVAQRHHHRHHKNHRNYKRVCPPHCKCIRDGFCRPGECSPKCRCPHCKVVERHHKHHHQDHIITDININFREKIRGSENSPLFFLSIFSIYKIF